MMKYKVNVSQGYNSVTLEFDRIDPVLDYCETTLKYGKDVKVTIEIVKEEGGED